MKTPYALLLSLPTDGFQQGFPAAGCRPRPRVRACTLPAVREPPWGGTGTRGARGAAAYSRPFTVLAEQQHLNLVLHLIPSLEEVSIFPRPQVASELSARSVTDRN